MVITSTANPQIRRLVQMQKKARERRDAGLFIAEGRKMYVEAPAGWVTQTFMTEDIYRRFREEGILRGEPVLVSESVFRAISDTQTPQGVLLVLRQPRYKREDLCPDTSGRNNLPPFLLVLEHLQDPGNLGTIFRTAEGAGVSGIFLSADSADPFNPKVVRSTMGSIYRMPFFITEQLTSDMEWLRKKGVVLFAAHLEGSVPYDSCDYTGPCALLIGNEANGLTDAATRLADTRIRIPMCGKVESLNAGVAASILAYEARRQRSRT